MIEMIGAVATVCVLVVFLISLMNRSTTNKVLFTTLILGDVILIFLLETGIISLFEAGIIFH